MWRSRTAWRFRISKRDRPFRFARSRVSKFLRPKERSWWAGSRRCKNDHATCCHTSQIRTRRFRRSGWQLCLLIRFARFRSEARNPFLRVPFCPFSPIWRSLLLGSAWVLPPVLEKLSPPQFSWELVLLLVLDLSLLLMQEWHSASPVLLLAIRFHSSRLLRRAFPLWLHPVPIRGIQCQWLAALVVAIPVFPIRLPRDLPRHPTTRCSRDSMKPSLQHSSGSVPR